MFTDIAKKITEKLVSGSEAQGKKTFFWGHKNYYNAAMLFGINGSYKSLI